MSPERDEDNVCTLLSITCTTSWTDWVHGDLWLCPDGLLRRSRGWRATFANSSSRGLKRGVDQENRPTRQFSADEIRDIVRSDKRNRWITWEQIERANPGWGLLNHALHVQLLDGRKVSLRWASIDGGFDLLEPVLRDRLGARYTSR
jgi:hypothetical protein